MIAKLNLELTLLARSFSASWASGILFGRPLILHLLHKFGSVESRTRYTTSPLLAGTVGDFARLGSLRRTYRGCKRGYN
jgi:hypothetical protein